jgi:hypothetical protein
LTEFTKFFGEITPLLLAGMITGLVELFKRFGLHGNWCIVVSMGLGVALAELFMFMELYPDLLSLPVKLAVYGVLFGLFVSGLYSLGQRVGLIKDRQ